ncbi:efflux RND transporter periplasmic adaptor subunit [soil metagenome]
MGAMVTRRFGMILAAAGAMCSTALVTGCSKSAAPAGAAGPGPGGAASAPPPSVTVVHPVARRVIEWDEYTGRLEAAETVEVRARVSGFIAKADFVEGGLVKAGDLLFEIDARPFEAELAKAEAAIERTEAAKAYAEDAFRRNEIGVANKGVAQLELENARRQLREAEASIASAKADAQVSRLNLEWTKVTAPIAGRISRKYVTPGNLINGGQGAATLLTTITSVDPIHAYLDVDERSVLKYQKLSLEKKRVSARDTPIAIFLGLSNENGFPHEGIIDFVDNKIDIQTGTLRGRGVFANPTGFFTPGMFVRLRVPGSGAYDTLLVPEAAIGSDQDQRFVTVVGADGTVARRPVTLGTRFNLLRAIESGVTVDDRVVITGVQRAFPGAKVTMIESAISTAQLSALGVGGYMPEGSGAGGAAVPAGRTQATPGAGAPMPGAQPKGTSPGAPAGVPQAAGQSGGGTQ